MTLIRLLLAPVVFVLHIVYSLILTVLYVTDYKMYTNAMRRLRGDVGGILKP
jgi:uncharacterized membrane protein YagU involved in acid resistance